MAAATSTSKSGVLTDPRRLPQDLSIEILSYLNLRESNSLAHVSREWHQASQVERRRVVELTWEKHLQWDQRSMMRSLVVQSPLARIITHIPKHGAFNFDNQEEIITAVNNFPNLLHIDIGVSRPGANTFPPPKFASDPQPVAEPLTQPFQLPPRLTSVKMIHADYVWSSLTCDQQQIYLDSLSTACQLHTVELGGFDLAINLNVLKQLPLLTDLTICESNDGSMPPIPDHVLPILSSLRELVSLRLGWLVLADQWSQLQLPHLRHISLTTGLTGGQGVNWSTDLVPLMNTVMIKSIRHLRLRLDVTGADLTKLVELVKFTQLEKLELWRDGHDNSQRYLTEKDIRDIYAALLQLKTLTSLKMETIYSHAGGNHIINISEILAAAPHLTALELKSDGADGIDSGIIDFNFLHSPLAHQRLVDLNFEGYFTRSHMLDGLLQCRLLRRLEFRTWIPTANEWWEELKLKLDSRHVLPALDLLDMTLDDTDDQIEHLIWDRFTGSDTDHPSYRGSHESHIVSGLRYHPSR